MRQETYTRLSAIAGKYADEIIATSFESWPQIHLDHALVHPVASLAVSVFELDRLLDNNDERRAASGHRAAGLTIAKTLAPQPPTIEAFFPKLGPVSWKEVPALRRILVGDALMLMPAMFASITARMAIVLEGFVTMGMPTFLHLFPHVDLSNFIEARFTVEKRQVVAAKWQRLPKGIVPSESDKAILIDFAAMLAQSGALPDMLVDVCLDMSKTSAEPRLLEVNPVIPELRKGE